MNLRIKENEDMKGVRLLDTDQLRRYTNLGRNGAMRLGEVAGAKVRIGKRVIWDKHKLDLYIDSLEEE